MLKLSYLGTKTGEDWQWLGLKSWKWNFYLENQKKIMATFIEIQFAFLKVMSWYLSIVFKRKETLHEEILFLRQQLAVYKTKVKRPRLTIGQRVSLVMLSQIYQDWKSALILVKPETVIKWHKQGFKLFWRWKSRTGKIGRPKVSKEARELIRKISRENLTWGAPRIQAELQMLGYDLAKSTVAKYMAKQNKPPSQTWRTFLKNHIKDSAAIDFFTIPTVTFRTLFCFLVLSHDRRRIIHFNVTANPTAVWTIQQIREAFPYDETPKYLHRDRDSIYSKDFCKQIKQMGIKEVVSAPKSPWQNPYVERVIGSIRHECLDHVIVLNEDHLRRILKEYFDYYHNDRPHQSLDKNAPNPRNTEPPSKGKVIAFPKIGGLHHRYKRAA